MSDGHVGAGAEEFLSYLSVEKGRAGSTIEAYRGDLRAYEAWLGEQGLVPETASEPVVQAYVGHLHDVGRAPTSVARALVSVRGLHRFLLDEGRAPLDPTDAVGSPKVPLGLPKALTEEEVAALIASPVGDDAFARRDRAILEVLYGGGLRISELCGLSLTDIDLTGGVLRAFGKGSRERIVPVGRLARKALIAWLDEPGGRSALRPARWARRGDAEAVFLNARGGRLSRQGAWGIVRRHGERVGLSDGLTPHVLRHSCATHMLDHGADIRVVQELLGHASVATTQIYTKVSTERLREVYDRAHPRARRVPTIRHG